MLPPSHHKTTLCHNPEDVVLKHYCRESLKTIEIVRSVGHTLAEEGYLI